MKLAVVIPALNEATRIADVIARAAIHADRVLVVDDGSADGTADAARAAGATVLVHETNRGKGAALRTGLDEAARLGFDAAVTLDADGQHRPEEIPPFVAAAESGNADLVVGDRMRARQTMPFVRWQTNRFMSWLVSRLAGVSIPDTQIGFRLIRLPAWRALDIATSNFDFESEMLVKAARKGLRIVSVPVSTVYADEESKICPVNDTIRFFRMVWRLWRSG